MNRDHLAIYMRSGSKQEQRLIFKLPLEDQLVMIYMLRKYWRRESYEDFRIGMLSMSSFITSLTQKETSS